MTSENKCAAGNLCASPKSSNIDVMDVIEDGNLVVYMILMMMMMTDLYLECPILCRCTFFSPIKQQTPDFTCLIS